MPALKELKPNSDLLDANFYGYKLSLESVPVFQFRFDCGVDHVLPSDEQYSFLHIKAFGLHNHLYADPWQLKSVYFIDKHRSVQNIRLSSTNRPVGLTRVWDVPSDRERRAGHYNMCLSFSSPDLAVVTDGTGVLHVVSTGQRSNTEAWKLLFSGDVCGKEQPFTLLHCRRNVATDRQEIHCILLHIDESVKNERGDENKSRLVFMNVLEWVVIAEERDHTWDVKSRRQLFAHGNVEYAVVEESCQCIYVAGSKDVKFTADSEKPVEPVQHETKVEKAKPDYLWLQTTEDITVWFQLPQATTKCEVSVCTQPGHIAVTWHNHVLLSGVPWHCLDSGLTTWTLENGKLEVVLSKAEQGLMWQELVKDDHRGEEVVDSALIAEIHERLAHLCSDKLVTDPTGGCPTGLNSQQLEECDAFSFDSMVLARLDSNTHAATHQINLGGHQWLFSTQLKPESAPAICLRHDVDGCVWQPETPQDDDDQNWPCSHVGTFLAFGYVLASKQQKKFTLCAPDLSYVAVCEASRHVYLYRQPSTVAGELRNRHTGQHVAQVAKQQLVNLDSCSEVLGVQATNTVLFILCSDLLIVLHVNEG